MSDEAVVDPKVEAEKATTKDTISVPSSEYASLWQRLQEAEARNKQADEARKAELEAANAKRLQEVADAQGAAEALREQKRILDEELSRSRQEIEKIRSERNANHVSAVISAGIAGVNFQSEVAKEQALGIINARINIETSTDGSVTLRDNKTGQILNPSAVANLIGSPEFAHFRAPKHSTQSVGDTTSAEPEEKKKKTPSEILAEQYKARRASTGFLGLN